MKTDNIIRTQCLNCKHSISGGDKFCPNCSQKNTDGKTSVIEIFSVFFGTVFNYDSRLFKTIRHLFLPGKLTTVFFEGKHKSYIHPLRLFILSSLFFIAAIGFTSKNWELEGFDSYNDNLAEYNVEKAMIQKVDSINFALKNQYPSPEKNHLLDSLSHKIKATKSVKKDSVDLGQFMTIYNEKPPKVSKVDLKDLSLNELVVKYEIEGFWNQILFRQKIKILQDGKQFVKYIIGQFTFMALFMMPLLALILKLFYIRSKKFYIEHLIFLFHVHCLIFLLLGLAIFFSDYIKAWMTTVILIGLLAYIFFSIKNFYQQSAWKTFLKFLLISFFYTIIFILALVIIFLISLLIF